MSFRRVSGAVIVVGLLLAALAVRFWPRGGERVREDAGARLEVIAHRGVHHTFSREGLTDRTCTAARILAPLEHVYIENTIPSMEAAFAAGATAVEIDIHHTRDDHIVVFHDWRLECRTDGEGVTQEQTLAYLEGLDIGYGYTADGGKTFPLRGRGVGAMPTLVEVLDRFPDRAFVLHQKSGSVKTVEVLAAVLRRYPAEQLARLSYWGVRYAELEALVPEIGPHLLPRGEIRRCVLGYAMDAGRALPPACADKVLVVPQWGLGFLVGGVEELTRRAANAGSRLFVAEVDSIDDARAAAELPIHGIMTDRIEIVGPWLREQ